MRAPTLANKVYSNKLPSGNFYTIHYLSQEFATPGPARLLIEYFYHALYFPDNASIANKYRQLS